MKNVLNLIICFAVSLSCTNDKGGLEENVQSLELKYIAWACDCANWATHEVLEVYSGNENDALAKHCIFIEPATETVELPDSLGYSGDVIQFIGSFYREKGFPSGYHSYQEPEEAKVFRYTAYEVVHSNYHLYQEDSSINE
ncbi:MAG: hypothetical protein N4A46_04590 [Schleiferiaceae bacterium]|jgi:hypothetical protein|nr:hypothetical protein [Schleiferiaceae bacterium]